MPALIVFLALIAQNAAPVVQQRILMKREPIAVVLVELGETRSTAPLGDQTLREHIAPWFEARTSLLPFVVDSKSVEPCRGHVVCVARRARALHPEPFRWLLLLSVTRSEPGGSVVLLALVDTEPAARPRTPEGPESSLELARISAEAVVVPPEPLRASNPRDWGPMLKGELEARFRAHFENSGHWGGPGRITFRTSASAPILSIDDVELGHVSHQELDIVDVPVGQHRVRLLHDDFEPWEQQVEIAEGEWTTMVAELRPKLAARLPGYLITATGVALGVAGTVLLVEAGVRASSPNNDPDLCLDLGGETNCPGSSFIPFSGGILIAPLGIALATTGGTWSLGTWLFTRQGEFPWLPMIIGVAAGALVYGAGMLIGG